MSSMDASDEALADLLAAEANSIVVASNGDLASMAASSADAGSGPNGGQPGSDGGSSKAAKGRTAGASRRSRRPTVREEIDAW